MTVLKINGVDVTGPNYQFFVDDANTWLDSPAVTAETGRALDRPGVTTFAHRVEPRTINVTGKIKGTSVTQCRLFADNLKSLVTRDPTNNVLEFTDYSQFEGQTSVRVSRCEYRSLIPRQQASLDPFHFARLRVSMEFFAAQPYFYDSAQTSVPSIGSTPVLFPMGTAPVAPLLAIAGPATNPRIAARDISPTEVAYMELTGTLAGGETLYVNMDSQTIYLNEATPTDPANNRISWWTGGDFFTMLPLWGDYTNGGKPFISCSSGTMTATYFKAWQ